MDPESSLPSVDLAGLAALLGSLTAMVVVVRGFIRDRRHDANPPEPVVAIPLDALAEVVRILNEYDGPERRRDDEDDPEDDPPGAAPTSGVRDRRGPDPGRDRRDARHDAPARRAQRPRAGDDPGAAADG